MKYFYAVIYCNSTTTAEKIYNEYNNYEFELSNIRLNLAFIPDSLIFPQEVKEVATSVPGEYEFKAFNKLNKALNHTKVNLTWDETDPKRLRKFQKIMEQDPDDDEAYREFLASQSESEAEEDEEMDRDKIEEYRQKLLGSLSTSNTNQRDLQVDKDENLDIKFNVGFGEDLGKKVLQEKKDKKQKEDETAWEKYQRKKKEKKKEKKLQHKLDK